MTQREADTTDLAGRIAARLEHLGLSAREASSRAGFAANYLDHLMTGKKRGLRTDGAERIAKVLGWSVSDLYGVSSETGEPEAQPFALEGEKAAMLRLLAPDAGDARAMEILGDLPSAGIMARDVLIYDAAASVADGDIALARHREGGGSRTVCRRRFGHMLVCLTQRPERPLVIGPGSSVTLEGPVAAVWRRT